MRVVLFAIVLALGLPNNGPGQTRPNILWIIADDQVPYVIGAYGNKQVRTPNMDRLASQGMRFERAYCNSPLCTASRQSFLTGRYARTIGVTQLQTTLPVNELTLSEILKTNGYDTAAIGKMHFNSKYKYGFNLRLDSDEHREWLEAKGKQPLPSGVEVQPPWKPFKDPASIWLNSDCRPMGAVDADMAGTYFAEQAINYLQQPRKQPFFLVVSFTEPHSPFHFPVEYRNRHRPEEFRPPQPGPEDDWQIPEIFRSLTDRQEQGIIAAYYTSVEFLDQNVGRVLAALESSGTATNTLVMFLGDNGYMLGQHGRFEKHCGYEEAIHCPLLIRLPHHIKEHQQTGALVEFIDLFPTVLDFAGVPIPSTVQGKSLVPLLTGKTKHHRSRVFIEYSENEEGYLRTERWKFIYGTGKRLRKDGYSTGHSMPSPSIQLYDLKRDPHEMVNLAQRPQNARLIADFTAQLAEHFKRTARQPELLPRTNDPRELLDFCLQPHDVPPPPKSETTSQ